MQMQGDKNESTGSHSALQCELQIACYLFLGTGPISWVDLARIQTYKLSIISTLNRLQKALLNNI